MAILVENTNFSYLPCIMPSVRVLLLEICNIGWIPEKRAMALQELQKL